MSMLHNENACPYQRILAFDVGKKEHTYTEHGLSKVKTVANSPKALGAVIQGLDQSCLVICEATGGYESLLLELLVKAGIPAHRADAAKAKAFIRSFGTLAKTDALDAQALVRYGHERWASLPLWAPPDPDQVELARLVGRREELVAMRTAERNRAGAPLNKANDKVAQSFQALIAAIQAQIEAIEAAIARLMDSSQALKEKARCMRTLKGVGKLVAASLCALLPELGSMNGKRAASLAALAPHPRDSSTRRGYRKVRGGRPNVRRALFMAAMAAARSKGPLGSFYDRLLANGKKKMVALVAVMRKMIVILNARLRQQAKGAQAAEPAKA